MCILCDNGFRQDPQGGGYHWFAKEYEGKAVFFSDLSGAVFVLKKPDGEYYTMAESEQATDEEWEAITEQLSHDGEIELFTNEGAPKHLLDVLFPETAGEISGLYYSWIGADDCHA